MHEILDDPARLDDVEKLCRRWERNDANHRNGRPGCFSVVVAYEIEQLATAMPRG